MLAPDAEADQAGRYALEHREELKEAQWERHFVEHCLAHHQRRQHAVVHRFLRCLYDAGRKLPPLLNLHEQRIDVVTCC